MKVIYRCGCGVDVHKTFPIATIIETSKTEQPSYLKKRFSPFNNDLCLFRQWLLEHYCHDVCMESAGKYYIPVLNILEDSINVIIANPKWVKAVKGNKDDTKDSKWIGDLFRLGLVSCKSFLQKSLKKKADTVIKSIEGYQMEDSQKVHILLVRSHLDFVQKETETLDAKLNELAAPYENAISLLYTIPGIDRPSAITIISEIGTDMSQFNSSKRLCCWAGLTPGNNESANKKKSVKITRAGVYLKPALVQCAHAAVKSITAPYYKSKYERISKRRGKKRAIIAIARMILTAIYHMLFTGETWNPCDLYKIDMPQECKISRKQKLSSKL